MRRTLLGLALAIALALVGSAAFAAPPPSGGQLLQQVPPPAPPPPQAAPAIVITRPDSSIAAAGEAFMVEHIDISGSQLLSQDELHRIVAPSEGKMLNLADLQKLADSITALYQRRGFPFVRAYVPAQTLQDGRIGITVLEARYDSVTLHNTSRVHDSVPQVVLHELKLGAPVDQATLDRVLLLESDIPGTQVKGTLRPGQTLGKSALIVDIDPGVATYGSVALDDYGNAATGRPRASGSVSFNNALHQGDVLSLNALTAGRGLNYGRAGFIVPVYGPATQLSLEASTLAYKVVYGGAVDLESHGTADVAGAGLKQILYRSTVANLYAQVTFDQTNLRDRIDTSHTYTDRHTDDWHATLFGATNDATGVTNANLGITFGHVRFDDAAVALADAAGAQTAGSFIKYDLDLSRLQRLTAKTSIYAAVDVQRANRNLDPSEQLFVGGPNSVQAYDNGVASGTQGDSLVLELRRELFAQWPGIWVGGVFIDDAHLQIAKAPFAPGPNGATFSGAGASLNWSAVRGWAVVASLATPIGGTPTIAGHRDSIRAWIMLQKLF